MTGYEFVRARAADARAAPPDTATNAVADAQGWMDYLTQRRRFADAGRATPSDIDLMRRTFAQLDVGRRALQSLAGREGTDFNQSQLFGPDAGLSRCASVRDLLYSDCGSRLNAVSPATPLGRSDLARSDGIATD